MWGPEEDLASVLGSSMPLSECQCLSVGSRAMQPCLFSVCLQGAEKIQEAEEGSLPEWCNSEGSLLIRKRGLPEQYSSEGKLLIKKRGLYEWYHSEGRFLNKGMPACTAQFQGQAPEDNKARLLT